MQLEDINLVIAGSEPYTTIQAAVNKASTAPKYCVIIPPKYTASDTYTNGSNVPILDLRPSATSTGINIPSTVAATTLVCTNATVSSRINSVIFALGATAAAPITGATGGVFVTTLNLPQTIAEQVPFQVRACGNVVLGAGTYTATVQPLLYASTTAGFTAAAANAVYSTAAVNVTQISAATKTVPWMTQAIMWGDTTSGLTLGSKYGGMNNGALQTQAYANIDNPPTAVDFTTATPLQFASGVTLTNAAAASVINLGSLNLEM